MTNVLVDASSRFGIRKCPPGSLAQHAVHGNVRVVGAHGSVRTIEVDSSSVLYDSPDTAEFPIGVLAHRAFTTEQLFVAELIVPVADLVELDPIRDLEPPTAAVVLHAKFPAKQARA